MKTLNVTMICKAFYNSSIEVPDDMTFEDAIAYAEEHIDEINVGEMEWISDIEIDEDFSPISEEDIISLFK